MPPLDNPRHERFAQELAKGKTADEAYKEAGYKADRSNAAKLTTNNLVKDRVAAIQEKMAFRADISRDEVIERLKRIAATAEKMAETSGAPALQAARGALMDISKLEGWIIEKRESGAPGEFAGLDSAAAVREAIAARLGVAKAKRLDS